MSNLGVTECTIWNSFLVGFYNLFPRDGILASGYSTFLLGGKFKVLLKLNKYLLEGGLEFLCLLILFVSYLFSPVLVT